MLYAVSAFILVAALAFRKSKICSSLLIVLMFVLMAYSYGNSDYSTYELYFRLYGSDLQLSVLLLNSGLFKILCAVFTKLGLQYEQLLLFMSVIGFMNLFFVAKRHLRHCNIAFALLFIYPFIIDITQIRNFVSTSFLMVGLEFLISEQSDKKAIIKFSVWNLVATLFHATFLFYYILIIVRFISRRNVKFFAPAILLFEILSLGAIQKFLGLYTNVEKVTFYFSNHISLGTLIGIVLYYLVITMLITFVYRNNNKQNWIGYVYKICLLMITTLPMVYFSFEFMRLYRDCFFVFYVAIAYWLEKQDEALKQKFIDTRHSFVLRNADLVCIGMILLCVFSLWFFICRDYLDTVFVPVFEKCRLFSNCDCLGV